MTTQPKPTHTPEPWHTSRHGVHAKHNGYDVIVAIAQPGIDPVTDDQSEANAARIVACMNAMAGVGDPEAVPAVIEALRSLVYHAERWVDGRKTDPKYAAESIDAAIAALAALGGSK